MLRDSVGLSTSIFSNISGEFAHNTLSVVSMDVLEDETLENKNYKTLDNMFSKMLVDNCVSPGGNFENDLSSLNFTDYAKQC